MPRFPNRSYTPGPELDEGAKRTSIASGAGALIPELYGNVRPFGKICTATVSNNQLYLLVVWGRGPIQSINNVYVGDTALGAAKIENHLGTAGQSASPWLSAVLTSFTDTYPNVAYTVIRLDKSDALNSRIYADINGYSDIFNPDTSSRGYSTNPSLCLAHFHERHSAQAIDWDSVASAAGANETLIGSTKRRILGGLVIDQKLPVEQWSNILREYAGCYVYRNEGLITFRSAGTVSGVLGGIDHQFDMSDMRKLSLRKRPIDEQPNSVRVSYTDKTGATQWKQGRAQFSSIATGAEVRDQNIALPGFQSYKIAYRQAQERVNYYRLVDLEGEVELFDIGLKVTPGDVMTLSHTRKNISGLFRVLNNTEVSPGRWVAEIERHNNAVYSTADPTAPVLRDAAYPATSGGTSVYVASPAAYTCSTAHSITNTVSTIPFDTPVYDPDNNVTNNGGILTIARGGYYAVAINAPITESTGGDVRSAISLYLQRDGATSPEGWVDVDTIQGQDYARDESGGQGVHAAGIVQLLAGESIRARIIASGTTAVTTVAEHAGISFHRIAA